MSDNISRLLDSAIRKSVAKFDEDIKKSYKYFIEDLYLKKIQYKGFEFTVTNCELIKFDECVNYDDYKYKSSYDWEITMSLSLLNKVKLNYKDYYFTFERNDNEYFKILDDMIEKEIMIKRELEL